MSDLSPENLNFRPRGPETRDSYARFDVQRRPLAFASTIHRSRLAKAARPIERHRGIETLRELEESNRSIFRGYLLKESFAAILDRRQIYVAGNFLEQWALRRRASFGERARAGRVWRMAENVIRRVAVDVEPSGDDRRVRREDEG